MEKKEDNDPMSKLAQALLILLFLYVMWELCKFIFKIIAKILKAVHEWWQFEKPGLKRDIGQFIEYVKKLDKTGFLEKYFIIPIRDVCHDLTKTERRRNVLRGFLTYFITSLVFIPFSVDVFFYLLLLEILLGMIYLSYFLLSYIRDYARKKPQDIEKKNSVKRKDYNKEGRGDN